MAHDPLRECNDHLAQAHAAALAAGDTKLAASIERQWQKVARQLDGDWTVPPQEDLQPVAA